MKILILARGIPTEDNPQEGCFEWDQANALKSIGHDVVVMYLDARRRKTGHKWGISKELVGDIPVYKIYYGITTPIEHYLSERLAQYINAKLTVRLLKKVLKDHRDVDIIHAHYLRCIYRTSFFKRITSQPIVGTEHLSDMVKSTISRQNIMMAEVGYRGLNRLITVSQYLNDKLFERFGVKSEVCGNVLGNEFANVDMHREDAYKEKFRYVACGSVIEIKGFDLLIKAASELNIPRDKWVIEIIGSGQMLDNLRTLANGYGLGDNIIFRGKLNKHQIIESYRQADCFVLSSRSETFGVVLIEAMACGLPVISTDCGGTKGIVNDDNGAMIPVDDMKALKNAMEDMYSNAPKFNREKIKYSCLKEYSPEAIATKLTRIYNNVLSATEK